MEIFYNKEHKFAYTQVPKTGCTTIKHMIAPLFGVSPQKRVVEFEGSNFKGEHTDAHLLTEEFKIDLDEFLEHDLSGVWKFTLVRNPYARLVSGFNMVVRDPVEGFINPDLVTNKDFNSFVKCLVEIPDDELDKHFKPQNCMVRFDQVTYDYVGYLENMSMAQAVVADKLDLPFDKNLVLNPSIPYDYKQFYTAELEDLVYNKYRKDFMQFNYDRMSI